MAKTIPPSLMTAFKCGLDLNSQTMAGISKPTHPKMNAEVGLTRPLSWRVIQSNTGTIVSTSWSGDRANVLEVQEDWLDLSSSLAHHKCFIGVYISKFQSVIYRFETVVHTETRWPCLIFRANTWKTFLLKFFRCSLMSGKRLKLLQKQYCHKMSHVII